MKSASEKCDPKDSLERAGLNKTRQRLAVLKTLIRAERPLTVSAIVNTIDSRERINRVTVYRTDSTLREHGIVREIPTVDDIAYYEMACTHNPAHAHFYCRCCKALTCLEPLTLEETLSVFRNPHDFSVEQVSVSITGLCSECFDKGAT